MGCGSHRLAPRFGIEGNSGLGLPVRPCNDPFDPRLGGVEPRLAMLAQCLAAFVEPDRIVERDFAAFESPDHFLKRAQRLFKGHTCDIGGAFSHAAKH